MATDKSTFEPWMEQAACYFLFRKECRYSSIEETAELAQDIASCCPKDVINPLRKAVVNRLKDLRIKREQAFADAQENPEEAYRLNRLEGNIGALEQVHRWLIGTEPLDDEASAGEPPERVK